MIPALVIFAVTYLLMLALPKERPWVALCSAAVFMALGQLGVYDFSLSAALGAVDYNVLLMMAPWGSWRCSSGAGCRPAWPSS